jgi:ribose-phosphate pyrophosphokinase
MPRENLRLFAFASCRETGARIARQLQLPLSAMEERDFDDGEHKSRPLENVRECDVFVVQSLHGDSKQSVNDKLCRLLFFIGALMDASAAHVTAVVPYLGYARKDQKSKSRDPVTTRYVASLFEAVGTNRIVTMDVHNVAAYQNAFRCRTEHLEAKGLFVRHFSSLARERDIVIVSPDIGGVKPAQALRQALSETVSRPIPLAFLEKQRSEGVVSGEAFLGDVAGRTAIIIDDMISSGTTILRTARACRAHGATGVYAAASHGVFVGDANLVFADPAIDRVVVTDTIPPFRLAREIARDRLTILDTSALFAEAIVRIHEGGSIVDLLRTSGQGELRRPAGESA